MHLTSQKRTQSTFAKQRIGVADVWVQGRELEGLERSGEVSEAIFLTQGFGLSTSRQAHDWWGPFTVDPGLTIER